MTITISERLDTTSLAATCLLRTIGKEDKDSVADHKLIQEHLAAIRKHLAKQDAVIKLVSKEMILLRKIRFDTEDMQRAMKIMRNKIFILFLFFVFVHRSMSAE